jgi:hypothetical protein
MHMGGFVAMSAGGDVVDLSAARPPRGNGSAPVMSQKLLGRCNSEGIDSLVYRSTNSGWSARCDGRSVVRSWRLEGM